MNNQTPEIILAAVQQNGLALEYAKEQNHEICLAAVKQNGWALKDVKNQTADICLAAIKENGCAVEYVQNPTKELYVDAVNSNIKALQHITNKDIITIICNSLNILYLPSNANHRDLIIRCIDGKYRCWIGCQENISIENLICRIHNDEGGLDENPHRKYYIDFLKEHNLYNVA